VTGKPLIGYADKGKRPRSVKPKPVKAYNAKRGGHRHPDIVNEPLRDFTRGMQCALTGLIDGNTGLVHVCRGPVQCCHRITQGSGKASDENNTWPGCDLAHRQQEGKTQAFERRYGINLSGICRRVTNLFYKLFPLAPKSKRAQAESKGERE